MSQYLPTEITKCCDTGIETASFDYYTGIKYVVEHNIPQTTKMSLIQDGSHFIVCCGDVMIGVQPTDFPEIERRIF